MKRFTAIILTFLLAILLPFTASAATGNDFQQHLTSLESHVQSGQLAKSIKAGQLDDWSLISLARDNVLTQENKNSSLKLLAERTDLSGQNLEKTIISLKALGQDPSRFNSQDLTAKLAGDTSLKGIYDDVYGLIALTGSKVPADAVNTPDKLIDTILKLAAPAPNGGGGNGWGFDPATPDVDTTGAVLAALAPYQSEPKVSEAINHAVDYLAAVKSPDGGFSNYGENSNTTAEAVIGLTAVGINPATDPRFNKNGKNPLTYLYPYEKPDGDYYWSASYPGDPVVSNDEVLKAYVAYKVFLSGGKLFVFPAATASAPVVKTPSTNEPAQQPAKTSTTSSGAAATPKTASKQTTSAVASKTSQPVSASRAVTKLASAESPAAQQPVSGSAVSTTAAAPETSALSGSPAAVSAKKQTPEKRSAKKKAEVKQASSKQASAPGNTKSAPQTKAVRSTRVNPVILIAGIIVALLGAAALIFRKMIWRRRA
ncbi:prenyltransferase UbiA [Sporolactobacillus vineae]|uniref:prenyltransferase UbiA n=1 Tax=Sporolactobacillus vineae TaxID=444463 RepID=UPI0002882814|nr:prenyltransferase UbiA [Sporolactobacillus vineae]